MWDGARAWVGGGPRVLLGSQAFVVGMFGQLCCALPANSRCQYGSCGVAHQFCAGPRTHPHAYAQPRPPARCLLRSQTTARVWDTLLHEGPKVLFRVALALLKLGEATLLQQVRSAGVQAAEETVQGSTAAGVGVGLHAGCSCGCGGSLRPLEHTWGQASQRGMQVPCVHQWRNRCAGGHTRRTTRGSY